MVEEVVLRVSQGAKGVKLHPGLFPFFPDDEELWPHSKGVCLPEVWACLERQGR